MQSLDETHDVSVESWIDEANREGNPFPLQNLPYAVFRQTGRDEAFRIGVGIGNMILDLAAVRRADAAGMLRSDLPESLEDPTLNRFMSEGRDVWQRARKAIFALLKRSGPGEEEFKNCLVSQDGVEYALPMIIPDYTDFYASIDHARNIGKLFRPDNPLMPNYEWVPIAYHGRSSSIVVSGTSVTRPQGQISPDANHPPFMAPSRRLDYEMEVGLVIGGGNTLGKPISIEAAEEYLFGLCLLNDWSARDIQAWEYQPLGPFLGKNFASSISPWIVTMEALRPFRTTSSIAEGRNILSYLRTEDDGCNLGVDMELEVFLQSENMQTEGQGPVRLGRSNFSYSYWTPAQMIAHHTVNGCNLRPGDLFGSGTMSGPGEDQTGALIEITRGGQDPVTISTTEQRNFLEDGDTVIMTAWCRRDGYRSIGFGECTGTILPAAQPVRGN